MADSIEDILGYDPRRPFQGFSRDPDVYGDLSIKPFSDSYSHRGLSPSRQVEALQNRAPESKQYGRSIYDVLPESLSKEIKSYDARTLPDLFLKGLTSLSPIDLIDLMNPTPSYKESEMFHSKKGRYKHLDQDPLAAPPVVSGLTRLPSEPSYGSSEQLKELMKHYGLVTDKERPISELISAFAAPMAAMRAPRVINSFGAAAKRPFTPVTATIEGVAPDLGQVSSEGWKQGITDRLIGGKDSAIDVSNFAGQPTTSRSGFGAWKKERNPLLAVDVPNISDISKNPEFRTAMNQTGADLNQEGMAAHRFLPNLINTMGGSSAALIKPRSGDLTPEQFTKLHSLLGDSMAFTHNPRLGGAVVYPFGEVKGGQTPEELRQALTAAREVLGTNNMNVKFGKADYNKDRFYSEAADYGATANPEVTRIRNLLKSLERQAIVPEEGVGNLGGIQSWSRGKELPTHVRAEGNLNPVQWRPVNFETGQEGKLYSQYRDAEAAREAMREQWLSTLPNRVR